MTPPTPPHNPPTDSLPEWAKNLKKYRLEQGMNQSEFADYFGVTRMTVWNWEAAVFEPPVRVLAWMLEASGVIHADMFFIGGVMRHDQEDLRHGRQ